MNKKDISLFKRLVDVRLKMQELEEEIEKDIGKYWKLQYDKIELKHTYGSDFSAHQHFYDSILKDDLRKREIKERILVDMKKLYEMI